MALTHFIRETWVAAIDAALQENSVGLALFRKNYGGDIERGKTIHLSAVVPPTITNYATSRTTTAEAVADDGDALPIDHADAFDFKVDDIDKAQAAGSFEEYTRSAALALAEKAEGELFKAAKAGGSQVAGVTGPKSFDDAFAVVRDIRKAMSKNKVPQGERVLVVNAEFAALLLDSKGGILVRADESGTPAGLREATLGNLLGFTVVQSEAVPVVNTPAAYGIWKPALAYVSQIDEVETMRAHDSFADRVRGLHVYGVKALTYYRRGISYVDAAPVP